MARSFHELPSRSQTAVFVVLGVLTAGAAWRMYVSPERAAIASRRDRLAALDSELVRARGIAARLPGARRDVHLLEVSLRETDTILPEEKDPQDVLRNLHDLASDSLLDISSFTPKPVVSRPDHREWPIEIGLEGRYHDVGRFFDRIAGMSRLISVSNIVIKAKTRPSARGTVTVTCLATIFVLQRDTTLASTGDQP
jgi:type IV pilus assembly protein PilO